MTARFRIMGRLDGAGRPMEGTVEIDRAALLFAVRPLRRRRVYRLQLGDVATLVVQMILKAEAAEKARAKAAARRARRPARKGRP